MNALLRYLRRINANPDQNTLGITPSRASLPMLDMMPSHQAPREFISTPAPLPEDYREPTPREEVAMSLGYLDYPRTAPETVSMPPRAGGRFWLGEQSAQALGMMTMPQMARVEAGLFARNNPEAVRRMQEGLKTADRVATVADIVDAGSTAAVHLGGKLGAKMAGGLLFGGGMRSLDKSFSLREAVEQAARNKKATRSIDFGTDFERVQEWGYHPEYGRYVRGVTPEATGSSALVDEAGQVVGLRGPVPVVGEWVAPGNGTMIKPPSPEVGQATILATRGAAKREGKTIRSAPYLEENSPQRAANNLTQPPTLAPSNVGRNPAARRLSDVPSAVSVRDTPRAWANYWLSQGDNFVANPTGEKVLIGYRKAGTKSVVTSKTAKEGFEPVYTDRQILRFDEVSGEPVYLRTGAIHWNEKTGASIDFSTMCPKRCGGQAIGACLYCYVELGRKKKVNPKQLIESPYMREIRSMPDEAVKVFNEAGGMRMFSFGDFRPGIDDEQVRAALNDALDRGLQIKAITKMPEFVERFGDHPALSVINMSWDELPGGMTNAPALDRILELQKRFKKVQVRSVPLNEEQFVKHMMDPRIQVVTPFHGKVNPDTMVKLIKAQNPILYKREGEAAIRAQIATWKDMGTDEFKNSDIYREMVSKFPDKVCCQFGDDFLCSHGQKCGSARVKRILESMGEGGRPLADSDIAELKNNPVIRDKVNALITGE